MPYDTKLTNPKDNFGSKKLDLGLVPNSGIVAAAMGFLEGALKFEIGGEEIVVGKGQVLRIPSNVPHRAVALEDTLDLDIFSPIREDWLKKDDAYLRG